MAVKVATFGETAGKRVDQFTLTSDDGVEVDIITYGVAVRDWRVPVGSGKRSVVVGFDSLQPYVDFNYHFGALAGRVANRIAHGRFTMDGQLYNLPLNWPDPPLHTLHGGSEGLGRLVWEAEPDGANNRVVFTHHSPDGANGFPGNVDITATYTLSGKRLRLDFHARADRRTPINLVQHQYFNLTGADTVLDHTYRVDATHFTETPAETLIPTGAILPVDGTQWDLRQGRTMRDAAGRPIDYDGNVVLTAGRDPAEPAAVVTGEDRALTLRLWTDRPGVQVYNSVMTPDGLIGLGGRRFGKYSGFCLEDQDFPDAVNHPGFPPVWYGPGHDYTHWCEIEIA